MLYTFPWQPETPTKKNSTTICLPWVSESPSLKDCESRRHAVFALEFFRCSLHILTWSIWASPCLNFTDFTVLEPRPTISYRYLPWPCFTNTKLVQIIIISCMLIILGDDQSTCNMLYASIRLVKRHSAAAMHRPSMILSEPRRGLRSPVMTFCRQFWMS